jgi:hypothetical protein
MKECLAVAKTALGTTDGEVDDAKAANMMTHTELTGELNFFVFFVKLLLVLTLNLRVSQ